MITSGHSRINVRGVLWTLSLTLILLLDEIHVGITLRKWIPHKVVWVSLNKRVSVRESVPSISLNINMQCWQGKKSSQQQFADPKISLV